MILLIVSLMFVVENRAYSIVVAHLIPPPPFKRKCPSVAASAYLLLLSFIYQVPHWCLISIHLSLSVYLYHYMAPAATATNPFKLTSHLSPPLFTRSLRQHTLTQNSSQTSTMVRPKRSFNIPQQVRDYHNNGKTVYARTKSICYPTRNSTNPCWRLLNELNANVNSHLQSRLDYHTN